MFPNRYRVHVAQLTASALLAGDWRAHSMAERLEILFGAPGPHLTRVVAAVRRRFRHPPRDEQSAVVSFLVECAPFATLWATMRVRHVLFDEPEMTPRTFAKVRPLQTEGDVAHWLAVPPGALSWLADPRGYELRSRPEGLRRYIYRWVPKRSGGERLIEEPKAILRGKQRAVLREILNPVPPHPAAHGFTQRRSVASFVAAHVGKTFVARLDLVDFFANVRRPRVFGLLRGLGYPDRVAWILACLCTNQTPTSVFATRGSFEQRMCFRDPHLPQGAPTSPAIANLCARRMDVRLTALATRFGATYTRYADDLAFSGDAAFQRAWARFLPLAARVARDEDFRVNVRKVRAMGASRRQFLAGVVVNAKPNVRRSDFDALKATLHNCVRFGPHSQNREHRADFSAHLLGRIAWVAQLNPQRGAKLRALFDRVTWT